MADGRPRYPLNTAAQLVGLSPRTLRGYEEAGIIRPARVGGNAQRMYSEQDLRWLRCIRDMIHDEGLTVTAIRRLLDLIPCWEIRHCQPQIALSCAPHQNVPDMARALNAAPDPLVVPPGASVDEGPAESDAVEIRLVYGVEELGAVLHCSRCISAERTARRVAMRHPGRVRVTKYSVDSPEVARWGVLLPPALVVGDEVVASGKGISEERLEQVVCRHLDRPRSSAGDAGM